MTRAEFGYLPGQNELTYKATIALVYQGYLTLPETGTYVINTSSDEYEYVWIGDVACKKWSDVNFDASSSNMSVPQQFNQGNFIPTTILYANSGALASSNFSLTLPNGTIVNDFTDLLLQPFPPRHMVTYTYQHLPSLLQHLTVIFKLMEILYIHSMRAMELWTILPVTILLLLWSTPRTTRQAQMYVQQRLYASQAMDPSSNCIFLLPRTSENALCIRWPRILTVNSFNVPKSDVVVGYGFGVPMEK